MPETPAEATITASIKTISNHTKSLAKVEKRADSDSIAITWLDFNLVNALLSKTFAFELDKVEHLKKPVSDVVAVLRSDLFHSEVGGDMREERPAFIIP